MRERGRGGGRLCTCNIVSELKTFQHEGFVQPKDEPTCDMGVWKYVPLTLAGRLFSTSFFILRSRNGWRCW